MSLMLDLINPIKQPSRSTGGGLDFGIIQRLGSIASYDFEGVFFIDFNS